MSGSVDGYVYEVMRETEPELIERTRILQQSELLGFPPVACATSVENEPRTKLVQKALVDGCRMRTGAPCCVCSGSTASASKTQAYSLRSRPRSRSFGARLDASVSATSRDQNTACGDGIHGRRRYLCH